MFWYTAGMAFAPDIRAQTAMITGQALQIDGGLIRRLGEVEQSVLESIYYVISWVCRRACPHCYDERFRPYPDEEADRLAQASQTVFPRVVRHLPETMLYTDLEDQQDDGTFRRKPGRIIVSGGEVLLDPTRTARVVSAAGDASRALPRQRRGTPGDSDRRGPAHDPASSPSCWTAGFG